MISTDIQKYCLNWREEAVELFASALDRIYGLEDFFGWHCKRQKTSKVYVVDAFCPPLSCVRPTTPPEDSELVIPYPEG